jgi:hypothetical protein
MHNHDNQHFKNQFIFLIDNFLCFGIATSMILHTYIPSLTIKNINQKVGFQIYVIEKYKCSWLISFRCGNDNFEVFQTFISRSGGLNLVQIGPF